MIQSEKMAAVELEKILEQYELNRIHTDVFEKIVILVIASLGLITALAWDTALEHLFKHMFGGEQTLAEEITYAVTITIIAAVVSVFLGRSIRRKSKQKAKK
jgi:formate hydrogenlyase subunit 3/multisubunit Na+/H+ antiporter MnhD subunit